MLNEAVVTWAIESSRDQEPHAEPARRSCTGGRDIDSMDFLDFVALHKEFHLEVPESDYPQLVSVDGCVGYLERKLSQ